METTNKNGSTATPLITIWDLETNSLHEKNRIVHCVSAIFLPDETMYEFCDYDPNYLTIDTFCKMLDASDQIVGHNIASFDLRQLVAIRPDFTYDPAKIVDTLVLARALVPVQRLRESDIEGDFIPDALKHLRGKHSLEAWGVRMGVLKGDFGKLTDWSTWTPAMSDYCSQDVRVTYALYLHLLHLMEDQDDQDVT